MKIIGLTGGIGSGKTTVAKMFGAFGVPVYNSDHEAKVLMESSQGMRSAVIALLGPNSYKERKLNRKYIAESVFNDKELLKKLNGIVHPAVRKHFLSWCKKQHYQYVIQEVAIIFENSSQDFYDKIILVTAPKKNRMERIMKTGDIQKVDVLARMESQWEDCLKIPLSDFVIENLDLEKTRIKVKEVHGFLLEYS